MARVRLPKRPPTPSESEDETEESESSEDEVEEVEELTLPVGAEAEVRSDDPGFVGSFYEVTVTGHLTSRCRYKVVYSRLVAEDGGPLEETAAAADVRPRPPLDGTRGFAVHEAVEALYNEGWWAGVVSAVPPPVDGRRPKVYQVAFPTSRETMEFEETALRPHRVFQAGRWVPAAVVEDGRSPLFGEGTQVEVSQCSKNFGESWSPGSVLKVIGATNFLVQYTLREDRELATEIIDSQYIRPARTDTRMDYKYRVSRSSHVEVMHEGSWWPGVIREVLESGIGNMYVVKLKSYATDMDDVERVDELIVGNTHLRPHFDWDGKKWVRRLKEEFANGTKLNSRKRPSSSTISLYKEVGEIGDKHGSYRDKKLKNADVVPEPTSLLLSGCNDNYGIKHKSSSYPDKTMKEGNAVVALGSQLAPSALPPMAGAHLEQESSQKDITPSAPVPQSPQLQALMFGTFGQQRPLPRGPLLGMQLLNPHTEGTAAKSIEEPRNTASMMENLANQKNSVDNVELGYNVTVGRGMISEINTVNCIDLSVTPNDIGGSQRAVSQQCGGLSMDDRLSESLAMEHHPFVKTSPLWPQIEAMEIFSNAPQRPHLNQFRQNGPELHKKNSRGTELHDDAMKTLEEKIARSESDDRELGVLMRVLAVSLHHDKLYARLTRNMLRSAITQKMNTAMEISRLKAEANKLERSYESTAVSR